MKVTLKQENEMMNENETKYGYSIFGWTDKLIAKRRFAKAHLFTTN